MHLNHSSWLSFITYHVATNVVARSLLLYQCIHTLQFHLKLSNLVLCDANLGLGVRNLPPNHLLRTLRPDPRPRQRRLQRRLRVRVVALLVDLAAQVVLLHLQVVDLLDQRHVLFEDALVLLRVVDRVVLELVAEGFHVVLEVVALGLVLEVRLGGADTALGLLQHPHLVQPDDALLQALEVEVLREQRLVHVVFEFALLPLLVVDYSLHLAGCLGETLLPHSQVVNDKHQVQVDFIEMLLFRSHFIHLLVQLLNLNFSWPNVTLEFLDFVVKDELKLLKLLDLLLEVQDALLLFFDSSVPLFYLLLLELDVFLQLLLLLQLGFVHVASLKEVTGILLFVSVFLLQLLQLGGQLRFARHALFDVLGKFGLIVVC